MQVYSAARVLDPDETLTVHRDAAVAVDGTTIAWVRPRADVDRDETLRGVPRHDLGDVTLMPGLIDAHVHLAFDGGPAPVARMMAQTDAEQLVLMLRSARELLSVGVTTARDLGARGYLDIVVRDAIAAGDARGPRLLTAGAPLTTTGGHCWFMGGEADGDDEIRRAVRRHHKHGVDLIKVMGTGGFMTKGSAPWYAQFTADELRIIVEEAHRVGLPVAAHVHGTEGIIRALDAGVDSLEHCSFTTDAGEWVFDRALADRIAESGVIVSPTVNLRAPQMQRLMGIDAFSERMQGLHAAGVRLVASTDAGIDQTPHYGFIGSLMAMHEFGIPIDDVLLSATSRSAAALGLGATTGRLRPGLRADLIAVAGDPRADLAALSDLRLVLTAGRRFAPDDLPAIEPLPDDFRPMIMTALQDAPGRRP